MCVRSVWVALLALGACAPAPCDRTFAPLATLLAADFPPDVPGFVACDAGGAVFDVREGRTTDAAIARARCDATGCVWVDGVGTLRDGGDVCLVRTPPAATRVRTTAAAHCWQVRYSGLPLFLRASRGPPTLLPGEWVPARKSPDAGPISPARTAP